MIRVEARDTVTVVTLGGAYNSLCEQANAELSKVLTQLAETVEPPLLILDLGQTERFGSIFLETLIRAWRRLAHRGGKLAVSRLTPLCAEVFHRTNLDEIWPSFATTDEGVAALRAAP